MLHAFSLSALPATPSLASPSPWLSCAELSSHATDPNLSPGLESISCALISHAEDLSSNPDPDYLLSHSFLIHPSFYCPSVNCWVAETMFLSLNLCTRIRSVLSCARTGSGPSWSFFTTRSQIFWSKAKSSRFEYDADGNRLKHL